MLLGISGKDFVLVASSKAAIRGVTILKAEDDKTRILNDHCLMVYSGEAGDTGQLHTLPSPSSKGQHGMERWANKKLLNGKSPVCGIYTSQRAALRDEVEPHPSIITRGSLEFCQDRIG